MHEKHASHSFHFVLKAYPYFFLLANSYSNSCILLLKIFFSSGNPFWLLHVDKSSITNTFLAVLQCFTIPVTMFSDCFCFLLKHPTWLKIPWEKNVSTFFSASTYHGVWSTNDIQYVSENEWMNECIYYILSKIDF